MMRLFCVALASYALTPPDDSCAEAAPEGVALLQLRASNAGFALDDPGSDPGEAPSDDPDFAHAPYHYAGCYRNAASAPRCEASGAAPERGVKLFFEKTPMMTVERCFWHCRRKGTSVFALEHHNQCRCSTQPLAELELERLHEGECASFCEGGGGLCGGENLAASVYVAEEAPGDESTMTDDELAQSYADRTGLPAEEFPMHRLDPLELIKEGVLLRQGDEAYTEDDVHPALLETFRGAVAGNETALVELRQRLEQGQPHVHHRGSPIFKRWRDPETNRLGVITYKYDSSCAQHKDVWISGMRMWEEKTCIRFKECTGPSCPTHTATLFCNACCTCGVGMHGSKRCKVSPGASPAIVAHELGHLIGLMHTQSREDRDEHVTVVWDNIRATQGPTWLSQYNMRADAIMLSEYRFDSLMHYPWSVRGRTVFEPRREERVGETKRSGGASFVTMSEVLDVNRYYQCPGFEIAVDDDGLDGDEYEVWHAGGCYTGAKAWELLSEGPGECARFIRQPVPREGAGVEPAGVYERAFVLRSVTADPPGRHPTGQCLYAPGPSYSWKLFRCTNLNDGGRFSFAGAVVSLAKVGKLCNLQGKCLASSKNLRTGKIDASYDIPPAPPTPAPPPAPPPGVPPFEPNAECPKSHPYVYRPSSASTRTPYDYCCASADSRHETGANQRAYSKRSDTCVGGWFKCPSPPCADYNYKAKIAEAAAAEAAAKRDRDDTTVPPMPGAGEDEDEEDEEGDEEVPRDPTGGTDADQYELYNEAGECYRSHTSRHGRALLGRVLQTGGTCTSFTRGPGDQFTLKNEAGHCIDFFSHKQKFGTYTCNGGGNQKYYMDSAGRICAKSDEGRCFGEARALRAPDAAGDEEAEAEDEEDDDSDEDDGADDGADDAADADDADDEDGAAAAASSGADAAELAELADLEADVSRLEATWRAEGAGLAARHRAAKDELAARHKAELAALAAEQAGESKRLEQQADELDAVRAKLTRAKEAAAARKASKRQAAEKQAAKKEAAKKAAPKKLAPENKVPEKEAVKKAAPKKQAPENKVPEKEAVKKAAPKKQAPENKVPEKETPPKAAKPAGPSWTKHEQKYSGGYAGGVRQSFNLEDAKAKCVELGGRCAAVTCARGGVCTVRARRSLGHSPSGETTYLKGAPSLLEELTAGSSMVPELLDAAPLSHMRCAGPPDVELGTGPEEDCQHACNAHSGCRVALWKQKYWHCMGYVHCDPIAKPGQQFKAWRKVPLSLLETPQLQLGTAALPAAHAQVVVGFDLPDRSPGDRVNILRDGVIVASEMLPDKLADIDSTRAGTVRLVLNPDVSPDVEFLGARYNPALAGQYQVSLESSTARPHGLVSLELLRSAPTQPGRPELAVEGGDVVVTWTPPAYREGALRYAVDLSCGAERVQRVVVTAEPEAKIARALAAGCRVRVRAAHEDDAWSRPSQWSKALP